ncbi:DUF2007 domain-containing protein [Vibrio sp. 2-Bac 85]
MKLVFSNENHFIVNNVKNLIEAQSIQVFIKNEFAQGALGETAAFDCWPEVWVFDDADFEQAEAIANEAQSEKSGADWVCKNCNETNASSFDICWRCQCDKATNVNDQ